MLPVVSKVWAEAIPGTESNAAKDAEKIATHFFMVNPPIVCQ